MKKQTLINAIFAILLCEASGMIGALFTINSIPTWYATLTKPTLVPPNWIFGPVWTTLYFLMGIALTMIYESHHGKRRTQALKVFALQLALNFLWTPVFFGFHMLGIGLIIIAALWLSIIANIYTFYRIRPCAAYLLMPYLAWVSFASYLNFSLWMLN